MSMQDWLWDVAAKKVLKRLVQVGIAYLLSLGLDRFGVKIDPEHAQEVAFVAAYGGLEAARNYAKVKWGWKFL